MSSNIVSGNAAIFETAAGSATLTGWAVGARTNGGVVVLCSHEQTAANRTIATLAVDGVSFTNIGRATPNGTSGTFAHTEIWACNDTSASSIVSSNPALTVTMANTGTAVVAGTIVTVTDVDQTLSNWSGFFASDGRQSANPVTASLTGFTSGNLVLGTYCDASGSISVNNQATGGDATTEFTSSDRNFGAAGSRCMQFYATAGSATPTYATQRTSGTTSYQSMSIVGIPQAATSTPTISSTSDDTPTDGSTLTINGTGFEASQGTGGVTAAGTGWTETSWSDTAIQVTVALGNNKYNTNVSLVVTNNSSQSSAGYNVQIQPASGKAYVNLSGTLATEGDRITAVPDLASGDQLEISNVVGGTISDVTVNADASFSVVEGVTAFDVRVNDGTWSVAATQYVAEPGTQNTDRGLVRNLVRDLTRTLARALVG